MTFSHITFSNHALHRMRQRGVPEDAIWFVLHFGQVQPAPGGASRCLVPRKQLRQLVLKRMIAPSLYERVEGLQVVINTDGCVVTVAHITRKIRRDHSSRHRSRTVH